MLCARIGPLALGPPLSPGPCALTPMGPGGALRGSGPAGPWALVGPCGDRALRERWALVGPPLGLPLGPGGAPTNT